MTDSVDDAYSGTGNCGDRNYRVTHANSGPHIFELSFASVAEDTPSADTHTMTVSPYDSGLISGTARTYYLETSYANYPSHEKLFTPLYIQHLAVGCDCSGLGWATPSRTDHAIAVGASATTITVPAATVDESSKSGAEISACYDTSPCSEGYTITLTYTKDSVAASKPAFITVNGDSS